MALLRRLSPVVLFAILFACGGADETDPGPPLPAFRSGSRLVVRGLDGGDGAQIVFGVVDAKLGVSCSFASASDGEQRCMPGGATAVFSDEDCTRPAIDVSSDPCAPAPSVNYAATADAQHDFTPGACQVEPRYTVLRGDVPLSGMKNAWTRDGKRCVKTSIQGTLFDATVVDPAELVRAESTVEIHTDGFASTVFVGDDGSRWTTSARLLARDEECGPLGSFLAIDDYRCVPDAVAWRNGEFFDDATCTTQIAYGSPVCAPELILEDDDIHGCPPRIDIHEVAGRSPEAFELRDKTCTDLHPTQESSYWKIGPEAPASEFPALGVVEVGTGRLRARYLGAVGDQAPMLPARVLFHDTMLKEDCNLVDFGDAVRCVPVTINDGNKGHFFADPKCVHDPVAEGFTYQDASCRPQVPKAFLSWFAAPDSCGERGEVTEAGAEVDDALYERTVAECRPYPRRRDAVYFRVGAVVDPSTFATVVERVASPTDTP